MLFVLNRVNRGPGEARCDSAHDGADRDARKDCAVDEGKRPASHGDRGELIVSLFLYCLTRCSAMKSDFFFRRCKFTDPFNLYFSVFATCSRNTLPVGRLECGVLCKRLCMAKLMMPARVRVCGSLQSANCSRGPDEVFDVELKYRVFGLFINLS